MKNKHLILTLAVALIYGLLLYRQDVIVKRTQERLLTELGSLNRILAETTADAIEHNLEMLEFVDYVSEEVVRSQSADSAQAHYIVDSLVNDREIPEAGSDRIWSLYYGE